MSQMMTQPENADMESVRIKRIFLKENPQGELMEQIQFIFHVFLVAKENEIMVKIDEWIRQGKGEDGQTFYPRNSVVIVSSSWR